MQFSRKTNRVRCRILLLLLFLAFNLIQSYAQIACHDSATLWAINQVGSQEVCGKLTDTGGLLGDYGANEDYIFTICPDSNAACIEFTLQSYQLHAPTNPSQFSNDVLTIYDGPDQNAAILAQIGGFGGLASGGGVCFTVQATSGCLSLHFQSDATNEGMGFEGFWESSNAACPLTIPPSFIANPDTNTIRNFLESASVRIDKIEKKCPNEAMGLFDFMSDKSANGLGEGIVLTTGLAQNCLGPNTQTAISFEHNALGNSHLDYLSNLHGNGQASADACFLEMEIYALSDKINFEYTFGSEEYPEFVGNDYNDVFAFFIDGPGIMGDPSLGNAINLATLPNSSDLVQVNTINNLQNWSYFRNNQQGLALEYDGFVVDSLGRKKSLTAKQTVIPCNTYQLRLGIADRGDEKLDSGVFIGKIGRSQATLSFQSVGDFEFLAEDCTGDEDSICLNFSFPTPELQTFMIGFSGSAEKGLDFSTDLSDVIIVPAGTEQLKFSVKALSDNLVEGKEEIRIQFKNNFGCGDVVFTEIVVPILDKPLLEILPNQDTLAFCLGDTIILQSQGVESVSWTSQPSFSNPVLKTQMLEPQADRWVFVEGKIGFCTFSDSIFLQRKEIAFALSTTDSLPCLNQRFDVFADGLTDEMVSWEIDSSFVLVGKEDNFLALTAGASRWVFASVGLGNCFVKDSIYIQTRDTALVIQSEILPTGSILCPNALISIDLSIFPDSSYAFWMYNGVQSDVSGNSISFLNQLDTEKVPVEAVIYHPSGCESRWNYEFFQRINCQALPNAFTPDGDGANDTFGPILLDKSIKIVNFEIYNRWGELVFKGNEIMPSWDGRIPNRAPAPMDVYVYQIDLEHRNGRVESLRGSFTLIR